MQVSTQIYQYLKSLSYNTAKTAYVEQLKQAHGVVVSMPPPRSTVDTAGSPSEGPEKAAVTLVEFSDFQCPYCGQIYSTLKQIREKYRDQVRLVFMNFPLEQIHPDAEKAAEAGLCAADQGRFWEMHDLMFQAQGKLKVDDLKSRAAFLKLDPAAFNNCLDSGRNAARVKRDLYAGSRLGVSGTPAMFINGRFLPGAVGYAEIAKIIDEELSESGQASVRSGLPEQVKQAHK
jgi:protein-disulfide isomerase